MSDQPNPFAAPQSETERISPGLPELHGRMPGSVLLATGCVGVMVGLTVVGLVAAVLGEEPGVQASSLVALVIGGLVLLGLVKRNRLARQWGRLLGLLFACLFTFYFVVVLGAYIYMLTSDAFEEVGIDGPVVDFWMISTFAIVLGMIVLPASLLWILFISLGKPTARQHFNLICPSCHGQRTKGVNFLFTKAKCKACGEVW